MNKNISIFEGVSFFWFTRTKDAVINNENKEITTVIDGEGVTQPFYSVGKFELFQFAKYFIPALIILTDEHSISIKNEIALLVSAATIILWDKYRLADRKYKLMLAIGATVLIPLIGIPTMTLSFLMKSYMSVWTAIVGYEIALAIASKEWTFMRKVAMGNLPKFFGHYFTFNIEKLEAHKNRVAHTIRRNVQIAAAVIGFLGFAGLLYSSIVAYKEYKSHKEYMSQQEQYFKLMALKQQSEQNGSAQIVIEFKKDVVPEKTQKLNEMLGIDPSYTQKKTITYPWEKGYRTGGTWVIREGKIITETITGKASQ